VQVLPGLRSPDLINEDKDIMGNSFVLPDDSLAEVAEPFRSTAGQAAASNH